MSTITRPTARKTTGTATVLNRVLQIAKSQGIELSDLEAENVRVNLNGLGESLAVDDDWRRGDSVMSCLERAASSAGKHLSTADKSRIRAMLNNIGLITYYNGLPGSRLGNK